MTEWHDAPLREVDTGKEGPHARPHLYPRRTPDEDREEIPFIGVKPYSHNIIGLYLAQIARDFGRGEANKAIMELGLEDEGWSVHLGEAEA